MRLKRWHATILTLTVLSAFSIGAFGLTLEPVGSYPAVTDPDLFTEGAAETVAFDPVTGFVLVSNGYAKTVDILDINDSGNPILVTSIDIADFGKSPTYVDAWNGFGAVTISMVPKTDNGVVLLFDIAQAVTDSFDPTIFGVGALPDSVKFTPNGSSLLVVNEGEPDDTYTIDPEGSISIVDIEKGVVRTADFKRFNHKRRQLRRRGVRIFGPGATVAQDLEPENIAVSRDSKTAFVTLQENNAMAVVDIVRAKITEIIPFGYKFHLAPGKGLDASDKDDAINIRNWPVLGMYLPDGIASFTRRGETYLVTANEGDARDYVYESPTGEVDESGEPVMEEVVAFSEEMRVKDMILPEIYETFWPDLQASENLGRLKTTSSVPFGKYLTPDGEEAFQVIFSYGSRSFSIWSTKGRQVFDSGDAIEQHIAALNPDYFNSHDEENTFDNRSDDKGPEPEGVVIGEVNNRTYAFISLERIGGVMAYDITDPYHSVFAGYGNNRDFEGDPEAGTAKDLSPEGMAFISAANSPTGDPLLLVANEVSGTTTVYRVGAL